MHEYVNNAHNFESVKCTAVAAETFQGTTITTVHFLLETDTVDVNSCRVIVNTG